MPLPVGHIRRNRNEGRLAMKFRIRKHFLIPSLLTISVILPALKVLAQEKNTTGSCIAPEYFGACDPYVPGIIITGGDKQPIQILSTWSMGPAEKAGVCPGDLVVAVNGISALDNTMDRMLRELVSESAPTPVLLKTKRGNQEMDFSVGRLRESALVAITRRKWMRTPEPQGDLVRVPLGETEDELAQIDRFEERVGLQHGFKRVAGMEVPIGTADDAAQQLVKLKSATPSRITARTALAAGHYTPGFFTIALKEPNQVFIARVVPASPANHAGLLPGDELLAVGWSPSGRPELCRTQETVFCS